jgi:hypothetical protein
MQFLFRSSPLLFITALSWLAACESKPVESTSQKVLPISQDSVRRQKLASETISEADQLARSILPIMNGVWIDARYWEVLRRTKSQHAAEGKWNSLDITELLIDASTRAGDTIRASTTLANHEGSLMTILLRRNSDAYSLPAQFLEQPQTNNLLRYRISGADSTLTIIRVNSQYKLITQATLKKVPGLRLQVDSVKSLDKGLAYLTNKLLFAGAYISTDSTGAAQTVTFTVDGRLIGLPEIRHYYAQNDFTGPFSNLDYLLLNIYSANQFRLAYQIRLDTLRLYAVQEDTTDYSLKRGKLRYELIRKR